MFGVIFLLLGSLCYVSGCKETSFFQDAGPIVKTLSGSVVGTYIKVLDVDIAAFLGIPFALPPLGERRFEKPVPVEPWEGVVMANEKPKPCMQYNTKNITIAAGNWIPTTTPTEDCLYLNVWSPIKCCCDEGRKLPVMVWIHGGGFSSGSSDLPLYDGGVLSSFGEVVVVSFNYRIGAFGYFYAGTEQAPGNAGMYDQLLAMKWVKENIMSFGGDPDSITLFGESAGSMSIGMHLISPLSRGLFNRVIMQSGSVYGIPVVDPPHTARLKAEQFSLLAGCGYETNFTEVVGCLKGKDALQLAKVDATLTTKTPLHFTPVYSNEFLPKSPKAAYESGDVAPVEILAGLMQNEGSVFLHYSMPQLFPYDSDPQLNLQVARGVVQGLYSMLPQAVIDAVWHTYFQSVAEGDTPAIVSAIRESYGDFVFNCPVQFFVEKVDNAYLYWMTHRSFNNPLPEWVGVTHFDDVPYVFGRPITDAEIFTPEDAQFSKDLIRKWVSFARSGHPLAQNQDSWPRFNSTDPTSYQLDPRDYKTMPFPKMQSCEFWRMLLSAST